MSDIPSGMQIPQMEKILYLDQLKQAQQAGADINSAQYQLGVNNTPGGVAFLGNSPDSYVNALNQEKTWLREDLNRREGYAREDNAYHRLFAELQSLGVNPALLMSNVSSPVGNAASYTTSAFKNSNMSSTERTDAANSAKMFGAIIAALALIIAAA